MGTPDDASKLGILFDDPDSMVALAAIKTTCMLSGEALSVDDLKRYLNDNDAESLSAALGLLMQYGEIVGIRIAVDRLEELRKSNEPADQCAYAASLSRIGSRTVDDLILMRRDATDIVLTAITEGLGKLRNHRALPCLYEDLQAPRRRIAAERSLRSMSNVFRTEILDEFAKTHNSIEFRSHLAGVVADIREPETGDSHSASRVTRELIKAAKQASVQLRNAAAKGLARRAKKQNNPIPSG